MKGFSLKSSFMLLCVVVLTAAGCRRDPVIVTDLDLALEENLRSASGGQGLSHFQLPDDGDYNRLPQDPLNPITRSKVELGKILFHETALGTNPREAQGAGTYSCASCHHVGAGFQAGVIQGIGEGGVGFGVNGEARKPNPGYVLDSIDVQPIRTPSALNIAYQECVLWNGQFGATGINAGTQAMWTTGTPKETNHLGYQGTEIQAIAGLKVHRSDVTAALENVSPDYKALFDQAFPQVPEVDRMDRERAGLAIAAYERTLVANQAPFQRWLRGDKSAMDDQEKHGAVLFFGKARCYTCHNGPALNSMEFHALGMADLSGFGTYGVDPNHAAHLGRGGFTGKRDDEYKFKVPQLYNLKDSPFFGHGGTFTSVYNVVRYKNAAVPQNTDVPSGRLSSEFRPLQLTEQEVTDIAVFVERSLYDPGLRRYVPASTLSGQCFPNNDALSKIDLGCN
ncbi:MAG: cytochrome c peroxidase [Bacteroidota bacterium]